MQTSAASVRPSYAGPMTSNPGRTLAAMRCLTALSTGTDTDADADLFARTAIEAAQELPQGWQDLTYGLLDVSHTLVKVLASQIGVTPSILLQTLAANGLGED